jgi:aspartate/methionine/tyrosine aminotransferase
LFSKRTDWELSENPLSLELSALRAKGVFIFDLTESNPTRAGIVYPKELLAAFSDPANLHYAPSPKGMLKAREAVARYYADKHVKLSPEDLVLTSSSSEAYAFLFRLLMNPNDRVLLPAPSYPLFSYLAGLSDVDVAYYRLYFDGEDWRIDFDSLEEAADRDARAVILVSPNNPTGSCIHPDEIVRLNALCSRNKMAIISDEVFADYIFDEKKTAYQSLAGNSGALSFALGGLSKAMAMPQMKLGWIAANGPKKQVEAALERLEVIADTYLSVNTPVQNAAGIWLPARALIRDQVMARVKANYDHLLKTASDVVKVFPVQGGWYAVLKTRLDVSEDEWALELLREHHVSVHPGFFFDFDEEGYIVVSLLTPEDTFREGLARVLSFIEK